MSLLLFAALGACSAPPVSCTDGVHNGQETDVDCGGGGECAPCPDGKVCLASSDCQGGACAQGVCGTGTSMTPSCTDQLKSGAETDVDCGGGACPACANNKQCVAPSDCQSNTCSGGTCTALPEPCSDGIKNGAETDVDCGGGTCAPCATGQACAVLTDCGSQSCSASVCGALGTIFPFALTVGRGGEVYTVDTVGNVVLRITPAGVASVAYGLLRMGGSADGTGFAARFQGPQGISSDSSGNLYIGDTVNDLVRKITPAGVVTTVAGMAGMTGSTDGTGAAARFSRPNGVVADGSGNLYVADYRNDTIRKITSAGVVTTFAGSAGQTGSVDGTGAAARFDSPIGIAADSSGNLYVADSFNHAIRKITPAGVVTTFAGTLAMNGSTDGTGAAARFNSPSGVALDSSGNLYVADTSNSTIRKITPAGEVTTLAGSAQVTGSADGTGADARFNSPRSVAVDSGGNVLVGDFTNRAVRKVTPEGVVTTLFK